MSNETFNLLFEKQFDNITNYADPKFTGGIKYIFNPLRHLNIQMCKTN